VTSPGEANLVVAVFIVVKVAADGLRGFSNASRSRADRGSDRDLGRTMPAGSLAQLQLARRLGGRDPLLDNASRGLSRSDRANARSIATSYRSPPTEGSAGSNKVPRSKRQTAAEGTATKDGGEENIR
jgi:hypothetical protein